MDPAHLLLHNPQASHHQPSPSSSGPQIRSRITVVCAECKRLKLKCDRKSPCGSCTKRDAVVRCIYSPAAAEKVDLHSLNNRMIQVEGILAMITAGQNPPAFQSSYPFSNPQSSPFTSPKTSQTHGLHQHQHHHHYAASPSHLAANDSFALTAHDLTSIWLADLDLGLSLQASSPSLPFFPVPGPSGSNTQRQRAFSNAENTGLIKLEPSPIDIELSRSQPPPQTSAAIDVDTASRSAFPSRAPSPLKRNPYPRPPIQPRRTSTQLLLPALSIYYPLPSIPPPGSSTASSAAFPRHLPSNNVPSSSASPSTSPVSGSANSGQALPAPQPQFTKPQVTPALLALLPSLQACKRLLTHAREVLRVRPIPFEPVGMTARTGSTQGHLQGQGQTPELAWQAFERRCLTLLGGGVNKERERERERKEREKEKARDAKRARQIYFGGILGMQPEAGTEMDVDGGEGATGNTGGRSARARGESAAGAGEDASGEDQSLTFFALMCAVLAMGASVSPPPPSSSNTTNTSSAPLSPHATAETPAFLYALSQQALGVWDTHHTTLASAAYSAAGAAAEETERMDFLLACIAGLGYLLLTGAPGRGVGSSVGLGAGGDDSAEREYGLGLGSGFGSGLGAGAGTGSSAALIYALVGKLVNAARAMGLGRDASVLASVLSRKGKQPQTQSHQDSASAPNSGAQSQSVGLGSSSGSGSTSGTTNTHSAGGGRGLSKREREAERERIREEWKKMIWWEVLFYDLFTADALGHQPYIPAHLYGVKLPACASLSQLPSMMAPAPAPHGDEQESDIEEDDGAGVPIQQDSAPNSFRENVGKAPDGVERAEEEYLGARYSLTQLAQSVKNRLLHPDCCCGYTLDQAAVLEAEIRRWQAALPASLKWVDEAPIATPTLAPAVIVPGAEPHTTAAVVPPFATKPSAAELMKALQRCELAVMANVLLIKVYTPFLRNAAASSASVHGPASSLAAPISSSAAQTTVYAAHAILKAAKEIYGAPAVSSSSFSPSSQSLLSTSLLSISLSSSPTSSSSPSASPGKTAAPAHKASATTAVAAVSPSMFDLYPLDKLVFDAVVICAHAAHVAQSRASFSLSSSSPAAMSLAFAGQGNAALTDDVVATLAWLLGESLHGTVVLGDEQRKVAEALYKRAICRSGANHGMKRKHSQVDLTNPFAPTVNTSAANPMLGHDWNSVNAIQVEQYQQPHSNVVELRSSSPSTSRSSVPPAHFPQDNLMRSEHQKQEIPSSLRRAVAARINEQGDDEKEKKHAKKEKNPSYPTVGVRVRPNKDREHSSRPSRKHSSAGSPGNSQPLMTSTPRSLPTADAVLAFQQHQKQKLMVSVQPQSNSQSPSVMYDQDLGRSRSSSISHIQSDHSQQQQQQQQQQNQHQHQQHSSQNQSQRGDGSSEDLRYPYFGAPNPSEVADMHMMQRRRFSVDQQSHPQHQQQQHQQQNHSPQQPPFTPNVYEQAQAPPQVMYDAQPYDNMHNAPGPAVDALGYSAVSSPFSNQGAPTSSSNSPFATTSALSSGHPSTPTFPPHHPSAPVFGPQPTAPPTSSPTTYFHTPASFTESSYPGPSSSTSHMSHQPQQHHSAQQTISLTGMNVDQTIISIPSAPQSSYEKQSVQPLYEMKSMQLQQQMHQHQAMDSSSYEEHDMSARSQAMAMGMPGPPTWDSMGQPPPQAQQPQHTAPPPNSQPFWNNGDEYRFYS